VIVADGGALSWVAPTGGAAIVLVKDASASRLATTSDGKLLVTTTSEKVQRYTLWYADSVSCALKDRSCASSCASSCGTPSSRTPQGFRGVGRAVGAAFGGEAVGDDG
jgi:hypothetical protein